MVRRVHAEGLRERQNMREAARHRREQERQPNWAVINHTTFDVIEEGFESEEQAREWLESLPHERSPQAPEFLKSDDEIQVVDIG